MKKTKNTFGILVLIILGFSCANGDGTVSLPDSLIGTWQASCFQKVVKGNAKYYKEKIVAESTALNVTRDEYPGSSCTSGKISSATETYTYTTKLVSTQSQIDMTSTDLAVTDKDGVYAVDTTQPVFSLKLATGPKGSRPADLSTAVTYTKI